MDENSDETENTDLEFDDDVSKSKLQMENLDNIPENDDMNFDEPTDDVTLYDTTDKPPTESNNFETNIDLDDFDNSQQTQRSERSSNRSKRSNEIEPDTISQSELSTIIDTKPDDAKLLSMESDPFYLPGEFPTIPDDFSIDNFPLSHIENSMKEELCLQFVDNFKRQYRHLYGDRKPLFIKPQNECHIEKFVCSFINPQKLPYPEVYFWEGAANFVAEFLTMVPIVPCTEVPLRLLSPMTTVELQRGTSFEYATLLCSLLIGVGYNAYVVSGYATRETCFIDQSRQPCPTFDKEKVHEAATVEKAKNRYTMRPAKDLRSKFELEQIEKREKLLEEEKLKLEKMKYEEERLSEQPRWDPLVGQRVHAWVLVLAGKREVGEHFFIEALTGRAWGVDCKEYLGIESLWNNKNYWVNMQVGLSSNGHISFDLTNSMMWEYLLPGQEPITIVPATEIDKGYDPADEELEKSDIAEKYFDLPKSWARMIKINLKDFQQRSLEGRKETLYRKAVLEKFSAYQNADGLVVRCKKYEDRMLSKPLDTEGFFQNRHDKLTKRLIDPIKGVISEYFMKGKKSRLIEHHYFLDKMKENSRKMVFYSDARVDHLVELENSENKLITTYANRDDFLVKRITNFGKREKKFGPANEREYRRPFETITEEYSRNNSVPAHKDIHEIVFHLSEDRISVAFHTANHNIAGDLVEFVKTNLSSESRRENPIQLIKDSCTYFQIDTFRPKLTDAETFEYYMYLLGKEEAAKEDVRNEEIEMNEILKLRDSEHIENKLDISLFDRVRNVHANKTRKDLEKAIEDDKHKTKDPDLDYLEPFLLQINIGKEDEITKDHAIKLYTRCLQDFKDRLINKANLLQARFEKETNLLQDKQQWYQQNQNIMQKQDEEEYLQFCTEATFRITTLEKMLARHKQISKYKESELDKKMRSDKRLAKFLAVR